MWGSIPDWIAALATVATAAAIFYARQTLLMEQEKRAHERAREAQQQAAQLSAWVVGRVNDDRPNDYGIVVDNSSQSIFHDVVIRVLLHEKETVKPVRLNVLPPGRYFIKAAPSSASLPWEFPAPVDESRLLTLQPYMNSPRYRVLGVTYGDALRQRWEQDDVGRLAPVRPETEAERLAS